MMVEAIVPAFNEAPRIAQVVRVLASCGHDIDAITVVDDGSTDGTADAALAAYPGVTILRMRENGGKGKAMLAAVRRSTADAALFVDADLLTLRASHVKALVGPVVRGEWDMVCGLRDYGEPVNTLQRSLPIITGERCIRRELLLQVPAMAWDGYKIEAGINDTVARSGGRSGIVQLDGLRFATQIDKRGTSEGLSGMVRMYSGVVMGMHEIRAAQEGTSGEVTPAPTPASVIATGQALSDITDALARSFVVALAQERSMILEAAECAAVVVAERYEWPVRLASIGIAAAGVGLLALALRDDK